MNGDHVMTWIGNGISVGAIVTTFMGWTPSIAAVVALIWYFIQIFESDTFQKWIATRRQKKLAQLKAKLAKLEAMSNPPR